MSNIKEVILLKWGTLKGWSNITTEKTKAALEKYNQAGPQSMSAMAQHDDENQKKALIEMLQSFEGTIRNDWTGKIMTNEEAVEYVKNY